MTTNPTPWRARPVFVSSTFRDMQAERDHLRDVVFPALAERLRERRHHLEPIDLRWGDYLDQGTRRRHIYRYLGRNRRFGTTVQPLNRIRLIGARPVKLDRHRRSLCEFA